jgi:hypothetical protein
MTDTELEDLLGQAVRLPVKEDQSKLEPDNSSKGLESTSYQRIT